jgi:hypothetical protein
LNSVVKHGYKMSVASDLLEALQELRYACTDKAEAMADAAIAKALRHEEVMGCATTTGGTEI